jgi:uncharacterized damage-inducible protein DinB
MSGSLLGDAFAHHVWATLRLIDACLELSPQQLETAVQGTYGSILSTMRHLVGSDSWYLFDISGDRARRIDEGRMDLPELRAAMETDGAAWTEFLSRDPDPDAVSREVDEDDGYERDATIGVRLAQALHHGTDSGARSAPPSRRSVWNPRRSTSASSASGVVASSTTPPGPEKFLP